MKLSKLGIKNASTHICNRDKKRLLCGTRFMDKVLNIRKTIYDDPKKLVEDYGCIGTRCLKCEDKLYEMVYGYDRDTWPPFEIPRDDTKKRAYRKYIENKKGLQHVEKDSVNFNCHKKFDEVWNRTQPKQEQPLIHVCDSVTRALLCDNRYMVRRGDVREVTYTQICHIIYDYGLLENRCPECEKVLYSRTHGFTRDTWEDDSPPLWHNQWGNLLPQVVVFDTYWEDRLDEIQFRGA